MARGQISRSTYDVFLSFRGEDTRYGFTKYLYDALTQNDIEAFMDGENLGKGEEIDDVLVKAIEGSKIAIIVFSDTYASSTWCLDELLKILESKNRKGQLVIPVFYKVEPTTVRKQRGSYGEAMTIHEDRFEDDIEKVQQWRSALSKAASISGWDTKNKFEGDLIKDIVKDVSGKLKIFASNGSQKSQATARPYGVNNDVGKQKRVSAAEDDVYHNWSDMATVTSEIMKAKKPMSEVENGVYNSWNRSYVDSSGAVSKVSNHKAEATEDGDNKLWSFGNSSTFLELNNGLEYILSAISEKGTFGMRHIVELKNNLKVMAVKRLKKTRISNMDFKSVVEPIGAMHHENLLKLGAYYCSMEEKLLFYDFKPNRSVCLHLHGNERSKMTMDWEMRLKIAVETARGITYIHQYHNLPHGNIKSSNIILTDLYQARVSEYCLTPLDDPSPPIKNDGYCAPEVTGPHRVTLESDVYSFGVVLMELVTEKNPTSFKKDEGGLPRWVKSMAESNSIYQVIPNRFHSQDSIVMCQLLQVAITCTVPNPGERPTMLEVTQYIEQLKQTSMKRYPTSMMCNTADNIAINYKRVTYDDRGHPTVHQWTEVKYQEDLSRISMSSSLGAYPI